LTNNRSRINVHAGVFQSSTAEDLRTLNRNRVSPAQIAALTASPGEAQGVRATVSEADGPIFRTL